jgi:hypothetical protein
VTGRMANQRLVNFNKLPEQDFHDLTRPVAVT